jgi:hypothetical protein
MGQVRFERLVIPRSEATRDLDDRDLHLAEIPRFARDDNDDKY